MRYAGMSGFGPPHGQHVLMRGGKGMRRHGAVRCEGDGGLCLSQDPAQDSEFGYVINIVDATPSAVRSAAWGSAASTGIASASGANGADEEAGRTAAAPSTPDPRRGLASMAL